MAERHICEHCSLEHTPCCPECPCTWPDPVPGEGWQPIDSAPTTGPVVDVELWNGRDVRVGHYAHGDGDGLMPPFGPAWFYGVGNPVSYFQQISPPPSHWRPVAANKGTPIVTLSEKT